MALQGNIAATDYTSATAEVFAILSAAIAAQTIVADYMPVLRTPGDVETLATKRDVTEIYIKSAYQTVTDSQSSFRNGNLKRKYTATGMLGVQILCPKNDPSAYGYGKLLAGLVQNAFRQPPSGGSVWYSNQRIIEVGAVQNDNQINVFVTCSYETEG
jgi:hypothetical protein